MRINCRAQKGHVQDCDTASVACTGGGTAPRAWSVEGRPIIAGGCHDHVVPAQPRHASWLAMQRYNCDMETSTMGAAQRIFEVRFPIAGRRVVIEDASGEC